MHKTSLNHHSSWLTSVRPQKSLLSASDPQKCKFTPITTDSNKDKAQLSPSPPVYPSLSTQSSSTAAAKARRSL